MSFFFLHNDAELEAAHVARYCATNPGCPLVVALDAARAAERAAIAQVDALSAAAKAALGFGGAGAGCPSVAAHGAASAARLDAGSAVDSAFRAVLAAATEPGRTPTEDEEARWGDE
jgi:hypothetical protein